MEASALHRQTSLAGGLPGRSPLLRLKGDEQLILATRRGNQAAFETLVQRYQARLLAFCRHMLNSKEDAEDVLQEVFAASYNALMADNRPINTRPWLYRIARNRCLNHLRKPRTSGQDSMDIFERDNGVTTADTVHQREEFRQIVADVAELPETQRTALLLREIDALSYDQIAEAMDTTVPSVKSLLVRARVSLAEAAEARLLTCAEVRLELGQVAEGLTKGSAPVRRHLKGCEQCRVFRGELRNTTRALAAIYPIGPLVFLHKLGLAKLFGGGAAASGAAGGAATGGTGAGAIAGGTGVAAGGAAAAGGGVGAAGGAISAGIGTLATKAAAGMAAAALVTAAGVEVKHVAVPATVAPPAAAISAHPASPAAPVVAAKPKPAPVKAVDKKPAPVAAAPAVPAATPVPEPVATTPAPTAPPAVQEDEGTVTLPATPPVTTPPSDETDPATPPEPPPTTTPAPPPPVTVPPPPPPTPPAGQSTTPAPPPPPPSPQRSATSR